MTTLSDLCNKVIADASRATERPWKCDQPYGQWDTPLIQTTHGGQIARLTHYGKMREDASYIITATNSAEVLARIVLMQQEALKESLRTICRIQRYIPPCPESPHFMMTMDLIGRTINKAEEMAKELVGSSD